MFEDVVHVGRVARKQRGGHEEITELSRVSGFSLYRVLRGSYKYKS